MSTGGGARRRRGRRQALTMALLLVGAASPLSGQAVRWTGSVSYARGSYVFDEPTHTLSISNGLGLDVGPVGLSASLPLLLQNSQWVSQVGGVPLPTGGEESAVVRGRRPGETLGSRSGRMPSGPGTGPTPDPTLVTYRDRFAWTVGDPFLSASTAVHEGSGFVRAVRAQVSAKAPLRGVDSGVGTGEWDVGLGGSIFASVGRTFLFADVARWWFGDMPDLELRDGSTYGLGVSRPVFGSKGSVMLSFFGSSSLIESIDRPASLALGLSFSPRVGRSVSGGLAAGLSEASPDLSAYVGWSLAVR